MHRASRVDMAGGSQSMDLTAQHFVLHWAPVLRFRPKAAYPTAPLKSGPPQTQIWPRYLLSCNLSGWPMVSMRLFLLQWPPLTLNCLPFLTHLPYSLCPDTTSPSSWSAVLLTSLTSLPPHDSLSPFLLSEPSSTLPLPSPSQSSLMLL